MSGNLKPCGTHAAYMRHYYRQEEPCEACREAHRVYSREAVRRFRQNRGAAATAQQRAYQHALYALREMYPDDFDRLYSVERAVEGLRPNPSSQGGLGTRNRRFDEQATAS